MWFSKDKGNIHLKYIRVLDEVHKVGNLVKIVLCCERLPKVPHVPH